MIGIPPLHHRLRFWYVTGFLFPTFSVFLCWFFFYYLGHNPTGNLMTVSETVLKFPENRIFAVTMNVEAVILLLLFMVRNKITVLLVNYRSETHQRPSVRLNVQRVCAVLCPVALSVLSAVTLEDQKELHLFAAAVFFYGCILYFSLSDSTLSYLGCAPSSFSRSWPMIAFVALMAGGVSASVAISSHGSNRLAANLAALCQYVGALSIFVKVWFSWSDLPEHHIIVRKMM
jgi:hypothetical protein